MEKEYAVIVTASNCIVIKQSTWENLYEGSLADCYAFIKLTEEGYNISK